MKRESFDKVFFGDDEADRRPRFAADSPVTYEVWLDYAQRTELPPSEDKRLELLLESSGDTEPTEVAQYLVEALHRLDFGVGNARVAVTGDFVAADLTLTELICCVLPRTSMSTVVEDASDMTQEHIALLIKRKIATLQLPEFLVSRLARHLEDHNARFRESYDWLAWFLRLLVAINEEPAGTQELAVAGALDRVHVILSRVDRNAVLRTPPLWEQKSSSERPDSSELDEETRDVLVERVTLNRKAYFSVNTSRRTIKADAVQNVFETSCKDIAWAVVDSGIDATHPAFREPYDSAPNAPEAAHSRVVATYDFTKVRDKLAIATEGDLKSRFGTGGEVHWAEIVEDGVRIDHDNSYQEPKTDHGTHVAGILGANWDRPTSRFQGICPDIQLYDFRAFDESGGGNEFEIVAALQFIRWINERARRIVIAGVNLSFSIPHDVANYSCGWTPVCVEADRLVRSGVVVVAAAGNSGYRGTGDYAKGTEYRAMSVTDPGNTDRVITVGSTHRSDPHRHGVSFFSGRGPTADGRMKPDLVAPGQEIDGPVPGDEIRTMDGTSQAAPHVSGAAALLMARYRELIGNPERVKQLLVGSAIDLSREPAFQGAGLVDVLRAMQSL